MKNLLVVLGVCLSLAACTVPVDSTETDAVLNQDGSGEPAGDWHQDRGPQGCESVSLLHIIVDGHDYWVQIPTLCDSRPYIFKGDPGPDVGDPYDDRYGPVPNEHILDAFNDKLSDSSRADSAPVQ